MTISFDPTDGVTRFFIDASSLKSSGCLRKLYWTVFEGYRTPGMEKDPALGYGNIFHKFWERHYKGHDPENNLILTKEEYLPYHERLIYGENAKEFRTGGHLLKSCRKYLTHYPHNGDGIVAGKMGDKWMVEQQFAFPFWKSGDGKFEIIVCGTIDIIGEYFGQKCIVDHKTSSSNPLYREKYFESYDFDVQVLMYSWATNKIFKLDHYLPVLINAAFIKNPTIKAEKEGRFDGVEFLRSRLIEVNKEQIAEFENFLDYRIGQVVHFIKNGTLPEMKRFFDMSLCQTFGKCKFFTVCKNQPSLHEGILGTLFEKKKYEPLKFRE